jgi:hypothetical protein
MTMMSRSVLAFALALAASACSPRNIPGTEIESTKDTRAIFGVVQTYRASMEKRDAAAVMSLVAPDYFDTAGTPDPADDMDRPRLEAALTQDLALAETVRLDLTVRRIEVKGDAADAEVFYEAWYRVKTPTGIVPRRDADVHRMKLKRIGNDWKFTAGL